MAASSGIQFAIKKNWQDSKKELAKVLLKKFTWNSKAKAFLTEVSKKGYVIGYLEDYYSSFSNLQPPKTDGKKLILSIDTGLNGVRNLKKKEIRIYAV